MKDINKIVKAAMVSLLTLSTFTTVVNSANAATTDTMEKCYGIAKIAMNDCATATQSCAGSATKDRQTDAFILLPKGDCAKIADGSLTSVPENKTK